MRTSHGIIIGAVLGFVLAIFTGKPIHDLIWARDMEGDSAFFTILIVMPLFTVLGGTVAGCLCAGVSARKTVACILGVIVGAAAGLLIAIYGLRPIGHPFFLVLVSILGGAVGGGFCAGRMASKASGQK